jgi:glutamyl-Q tRNA(Asp) synthetase
MTEPMPAAVAHLKSEILGGRPAVTRLAPSPTGLVHLGHALSGFIGMELARVLGGRFLLRIEDIDPDRSRPEWIDAILSDLAWVGLAWEEPVLRQSQHMPAYAAAAGRLAAMGLLYPCFASRSEIEAAAPPGAADPDGAPLYTGLHRQMPSAEMARRKAAGEPFAMRIDMARATRLAVAKAGREALAFTEIDGDLAAQRVPVDPARWGDAVIQRKSAPTSYHLSVVVDDARQGVSIVTRGEDLRAATDIHRLLQILLDLPEPIYRHHGLILDGEGRKLSKRDGSTSLSALRAAGVKPAEVRRRIGFGRHAAGN